MNNVDKAMELARLWRAGKLIGGDAYEVSATLLTHLEAMEADRVRLLEALKTAEKTMLTAHNNSILDCSPELSKARVAIAQSEAK